MYSYVSIHTCTHIHTTPNLAIAATLLVLEKGSLDLFYHEKLIR